MLISAWLIAASIALAWGLVCKLKGLDRLEKKAIAIPLGLAIGTWAALATAIALQQTSWLSASVASLALTIAAAVLLQGWKIPAVKDLRKSMAEHPGLFAIMAIAALGFGLLLSTHVLEERNGSTYSAGSTWGDIAIHLSFINSFVRGSNALPVAGFPSDPTYAGARLSYPLLPDYNAAALVASGASMRAAIILPSLLLFLSLVALLYFLALRFGGRKDAAVAAVAIAILAGGIGFLQMPADLAASGKALPEFLTQLPHDYAHSAGNGNNYYWLSLVNDLLLPQRSALFAFPLSIAVFLLLWIGLEADEKRPSNARAGAAEKHSLPVGASLWQKLFSPDASGEKRKTLLLAGLATGLLPFLQGHAFIAVGMVSATACLLTARKPLEKHFGDWLWFFGPALVLGGPQMLWFAGQASAWGFARFSPVWQAAEPFSFWLANLGLLAVLAIAGIAFLNKRQGVFYAGFLAIFLAANLFSFQPWPQDNTKLFYQWVFAASIVASLAVFKIGEKIRAAAGKSGFAQLAGNAMIALLLIALIASGSLAVVRESQLHYQFHNADDIAAGEWIAVNTPKDAVVLASDWHAQPAATIAGRTLVMGYRGWLWSHGFDYGKRESDVRQMLAGSPQAKQLMQQYHVSYAVIGASETRDYGASKSFFDANYRKAYDEGGYSVYEIA